PLGYLFSGPASSVIKADGANERLRVSGIGVGGKGASDIEKAGALMQVVALCNIDAELLSKQPAAIPTARPFYDYLRLLDEVSRAFDAVTVSTPDPRHALPYVRAIRLGKHFYCQKSLAHTDAEGRMVREDAAKAGVVTQIANQGSAHSGLRRGVELVCSGIIG